MSMHSMIAIQSHTEKLVLQHLHRHSHNVKEKSNNALLVSLAQMQIKQPWSNIEGILKNNFNGFWKNNSN